VHDIAERRVGDQLHDYPRPPAVLNDVIHANDVQVIKPSRRAGLAKTTLPELIPLPGAELWRPEDLLDRHVPVEELVAGQPDKAHPATADDSPQPVPPGEDVLPPQSARSPGYPPARLGNNQSTAITTALNWRPARLEGSQLRKRSHEYKRVSKRRGTPGMDAAVLAEALDSGRPPPRRHG